MMDAECDLRLTGIFESKNAHFLVPRVARLALAVFIALAALVGLCDRLALAKRQAQACRTAVASWPTAGSTCALCLTTQRIATRCRHAVLTPTNRIAPNAVDTGEAVTITFVITGLGLKPVDVVLVQDISGSMLEDDTPSGQARLVAAQAAAITFVNQLKDVDRVAVVAFSETVPLTPLLPLTTDFDTAIATINSLEAQDGWKTNIGGGIQAGYEELISSTWWSSRAAKSMILLSDGETSLPSHDPQGYARDLASAAGECGIMIYTIGLGRGVSETLMQGIADLSGGEYYFSPDGSDLETIYREIALELRNLAIADTLLPGVDVDCSFWPPGTCSRDNGLTTTIVLSPDNEVLVTDPLNLSFTATVNLDPGYEGLVSADGPGICYDGPGGRKCQSFEPDVVTVNGRKITGVVFEDLDRDGHFDKDEGVLSGVVVTASNGLMSVTDISGVYVLRTSATPALTVAVKIPPGFISTTSEITRVPPSPGIYQRDFGLHCLGPLPTPLLDLAASAQVVRPGTDVTYTYTVSHTSAVVTLTNVIVEDSHLGTIWPTHFTLPPGDRMTLTATAYLTQNRTSTATVTSDVEGYGWTITGNPATTTVHVIAGLSLAQGNTEPPPAHHGISTTLHYSVTNKDRDDGVVSGTILIRDSLSRILDKRYFDLGAGEAIPLTSSPFTVPRDILITLTTTALDDVQGTLLVSDLVTATVCPKDIYEPDDNAGTADSIRPGALRLHDLCKPGDEDWVRLRLRQGDRALYAFTTRPLGPGGVHICLALHYGNTTLVECNTDNQQSPVTIIKTLSCAGVDVCDGFVRVWSPSLANGCWTDYELSLKETSWNELEHVSLPVILRNSP